MSASRSAGKRLQGVDEATRGQLVRAARNARTRTTAFTSQRPTDWQPTQVRNPDGILDEYFTDAAAWEFIATRLEAGEEVEVIPLRKPRGAKGFVMKIKLQSDRPKLYVKLQMGARGIIGRSFHDSKQSPQDEAS